jgi:hypothetical protein
LTAKIAPGSSSEIANPVRGAIFSFRSVASDVVTAVVLDWIVVTGIEVSEFPVEQEIRRIPKVNDKKDLVRIKETTADLFVHSCELKNQNSR